MAEQPKKGIGFDFTKTVIAGRGLFLIADINLILQITKIKHVLALMEKAQRESHSRAKVFTERG